MDGMFGAMNSELDHSGIDVQLFPYGIQNCNSDYVVHVGFCVGAIYVFPTVSGKAAVESGQYPGRPAFQPRVEGPTAWGYKVPWEEINGCREFIIPTDILTTVDCKPRESTTIKGKKAERVVNEMLARGLISLNLTAASVRDESTQIRGIDAVVPSVTVQVKCDYRCGPRERGGTGNLYLQTQERNPRGLH